MIPNVITVPAIPLKVRLKDLQAHEDGVVEKDPVHWNRSLFYETQSYRVAGGRENMFKRVHSDECKSFDVFILSIVHTLTMRDDYSKGIRKEDEEESSSND